MLMFGCGGDGGVPGLVCLHSWVFLNVSRGTRVKIENFFFRECGYN